MAAIDIHTHAFPDDIAARAIAKLEAGCPWRAVGSGTIGGLLKSMDQADVDISVVCAIATRPGQAEGILKWCAGISDERIHPLPSIHPADEDHPALVARIADAGFEGIKLHPMYQDFAFDDSRMDGLYQAAADRGLFIVSHCGLDIAFPPEDDRAAPVRYRRVIDRIPGMTMVCTHMGGWRSWDQVEQHLLGTSVYLETSFSLGELGPDRAVAMIRRHGIGRVMMGSDWPWNRQTDTMGGVRALPLTDAEKDANLSGNAAGLLGY